MPVIGTPAHAKGGLKKAFGDRAKVGEKGERFTSDQLTKLYSNDQDVWVFNNLSLPGWSKANLDHVIVRGNSGILIDTKCWSPGIYWNNRERTYRGAKRFDPAEKINLHRLSLELSNHLQIPIAPLVVIWPSRPGAIITLPIITMRLPDATPYVNGRNLPAELTQMLGKRGEATRNERALELLTRLTRSERD